MWLFRTYSTSGRPPRSVLAHHIVTFIWPLYCSFIFSWSLLFSRHQALYLCMKWGGSFLVGAGSDLSAWEDTQQCLCSQATGKMPSQGRLQLVKQAYFFQEKDATGGGGQQYSPTMFCKKICHCNHAVLTKHFFCDSSHILHHPVAHGECDFGNCYDRAAHLPTSIALQSWVYHLQQHGLSCWLCRPYNIPLRWVFASWRRILAKLPVS